MKIIILSLFCSTLLYAIDRIDSDTNVALDAHLEQAVILSSPEDGEEKIKKNILRQLRFLIGPLNHHHSTPDLGHVELEITDRSKTAGDELETTTYNAKFIVSWDKHQPIPTQFKATLPLSMKAKHLKNFYESYSQTCSNNPSDPAINKNNFYYYFRPEVNSCALNSFMPPGSQDNISTQKSLALKISAINTENKYPEYDKVWEDNQLVYTVIFATDKKGATSNDLGITSFNQFYQSLIQIFGRPIYVFPKGVGFSGANGFRSPSIAVHFNTFRGVVKVNLFLVDKYGVQNPPEYLEKSLDNLGPITDVLAYNGHSSYGRNIQAVAKLGNFKPERYHLFYFNGCDTFSYVDDSLRAKIADINDPNATEYQYLDMIVNTMPSFFHQMVNSNSQLLVSLVNGRSTFRQILSAFDPSQKALVVGEHDNLFSPRL